MPYSQYDKNGNEVNHKDLQAKTVWCKDGEKIEVAFIDRYGSKLNLKINPEKTTNPYAPDLVFNQNRLADLKTQNTPFFKAQSMYGIDSSYAVVFNRKDAIRYYKKYPEIIIYFWIEWHSVKFVMGSFENNVKYINGVWRIPFKNLIEILKIAPKHEYKQRKNDTKGNAKSSFVLDIRNPLFEKVV
ncbi:hypothetical protein [Zobellia nedashkovskayae]|uniref:hypothetical protein n=1 Tax=Zobellia nedashkovskayae TaxID=2779510 RepID=UPI00188DBC2D|nr:hypothetical protein [Zobellia nedashkovskayae]